jgi:hypothetical protein
MRRIALGGCGLFAVIAHSWISAHRTAALQVELARRPRVALAALVHGMVQTVLHPGACGDGLPLGVRLTLQDRLKMRPRIGQNRLPP